MGKSFKRYKLRKDLQLGQQEKAANEKRKQEQKVLEAAKAAEAKKEAAEKAKKEAAEKAKKEAEEDKQSKSSKSTKKKKSSKSEED